MYVRYYRSDISRRWSDSSWNDKRPSGIYDEEPSFTQDDDYHLAVKHGLHGWGVVTDHNGNTYSVWKCPVKASFHVVSMASSFDWFRLTSLDITGAMLCDSVCVETTGCIFIDNRYSVKGSCLPVEALSVLAIKKMDTTGIRGVWCIRQVSQELSLPYFVF